MKRTKMHTEEFRNEAIRLVLDQGYTKADVSRNLGICEKNLRRWITKARDKSSLAKFSAEEQSELVKLRKENQRLKLEREILKKAAAFFASERT